MTGVASLPYRPVPVAPPDTMAACPICLGNRFQAIGKVTAGRWLLEDGPPVREILTAAIGCCRRCGHTMVRTPYGKAAFAFLYGTQDAAAAASYVRDDVVSFCGNELTDNDDGVGLHVDFGCGHGRLGQYLRDEAKIADWRILGLDFQVGKVAVGRCRAVDLNHLDAAACADLRGRISFAYATQVLEHLADPRRFLTALRALLRPDGYLYLDVPNFRTGPVGNLALQMVNPQHLHYFCAEHLQSLLISCGFAVVRHAEVGDCLRVLARSVPGSPPRYPPTEIGAFTTATKAAVCASLDHYRTRRAACGRHLVGRADRPEPVALWGLGAEFCHLIADSPAFAATVAHNPRLALFDLSLAGRVVLGKMVHHPAALPAFDGTVVRLPIQATLTARLGTYAAAVGLPWERVLDPWLCLDA